MKMVNKDTGEYKSKFTGDVYELGRFGPSLICGKLATRRSDNKFELVRR